MTVLITGGAGYIGSHMAWRFVDTGRRFVVLDNLTTGFIKAVPPGIELVQANVGERETVRKIIRDHRIDSVIHFAGSVVVPESVRDPISYYHNNTAASLALISACVDEGVDKLIFSSTAAVYGGDHTFGVAEDTPKAPESPYGRSKLMTETMLSDIASATNLRHAVLRYFNVAGADPKGRAGQSTRRATHLIKIACEVAVGKRDRLAIYGGDYNTPDGTCIRDYIHVTDLVDAHALALDALEHYAGGLTLNCGYGVGYSVKEVISAVENVSGKKLNVVMDNRRAGDAPALVADPSNLKNTLPWSPKFQNLEEIVAHVLAWEMSASY
ncbi:UDP-glucose 4-epimerase GalE [uncultured Paracoccus sp.]|uniref:UDP-glucose 4-epimerase GalE n=1 Tax=uncultured Paracoccus sp. TaxID=189685 RepID=UPI002607E349|nr:UDP-glucose 4-epimerase GalE [uncultured Paracoccus sp.]